MCHVDNCPVLQLWKTGAESCQREGWSAGGLVRALKIFIKNLTFPSSRKDRIV